MAGEPVLCVGILVADLFVPPLVRLPAAGGLAEGLALAGLESAS